MNWEAKNSPMPGIPIDSENIEIIKTPDQFYRTLIEQIEKAERRVSLSSLYLGTGNKETALVATLLNRLNTSDIELTVLLDLLRGTRAESEESSVTQLQAVSRQGNIFLYHTPELRGILKKVLPARVDEVVGLQHMKIYVFDENVLISGANLSSSYFVDRQDRYYLFKNCKQLADFFQKIIEAVGQTSFVLKDNVVSRSDQCEVHPYEEDFESYRTLLKTRVEKVIEDFKKSQECKFQEAKTYVFPILQMGLLGIDQENDFLQNIFATKNNLVKLTLASGYFNLTNEYEYLIQNVGGYELDILTASPSANGFFDSHGFSKFIPALYSNISKLFLEEARKKRNGSLRMHEYFRHGWTFHAKGLWIEDGNRMITTIGSSNFGYRSVRRDLEAQVVVVTSETELKDRIKQEKQDLFKYSSCLDSTAFQRPEHHVPFFVRLITRVLRTFL